MNTQIATRPIVNLNGWQRLFVVVGVVWLVAVAVVFCRKWPTAREISTASVCAAMDSNDAGRLCDCGAKCSIHWDWPNGETWGRYLFFKDGILPADKDRSLHAFGVTLERILTHKRVAVAARALGFWLLPLTTLYAAGWASGWVRRGFAQS